MKTRRTFRPPTIREQCDKCRHFTGIGSNADGSRVPLHEKRRGTCRAGVNYDDVQKQGARMIALPCFHPEPDNLPADGAWPTCPSQSFKTPEELDTEAAAIEERSRKFMERMTVVRPAILKHAGVEGVKYPSNEEAFMSDGKGGQKGAAGSMPCPSCKSGTVSYTIAGCNGHVWAQCSTDGCVSWME